MMFYQIFINKISISFLIFFFLITLNFFTIYENIYFQKFFHTQFMLCATGTRLVVFSILFNSMVAVILVKYCNIFRL